MIATETQRHRDGAFDARGLRSRPRVSGETPLWLCGSVALFSRARVVLAAAMALTASSCASPRLTAIGDGWFVDAVEPGRPSPHLYREANGTRVLVDRQVEAYRLYANRCLIYEAPRADGRFLFVVWGPLTPVAFRESIGLSRWRLDADGPRRFETPVDPDGRRLLATQWINFGDPCYTAQLQPRFTDRRASTPTRVVSDRIKIEESTIDVNGEDSVGNSTLSDATRKGEVALVDELLRAGADPNSANQAGVSVLMTAIAFRKPDVVRRLIAAGARVDAQAGDGETALMCAAKYRNVELMKLLLARGADPKAATDHHDNALTASAGIGWVDGVVYERSPKDNIEAVRMLLDLGLDPNWRNNDGRTALMGAAHKGRNEVVQMLVDRGAKLDIRDKGSRDTGNPASKIAGRTWEALDYADGLVRFGVQSAVEHRETAALIRKLMTERGLPVPPANRTVDSICVVEVC